MIRVSIAILILAGLAMLADGATSTGQAVVSWTGPTTMSDLAGPVTYNVYASLPNTPPVGRAAAASPLTITGLASGEWCFFVRAVVNGVESVNSNISCKTVGIPTLGKPITLDQPIILP